MDRLPTQLSPVLRVQVDAEWNGERVVALRTKRTRYEIDANDQLRTGRVLGLLDGSNTLEEIAARTGLDLVEVMAVAEPLYCEGLLMEENDIDVPALLVYEHTRNTGALWMSSARNRFIDAVFGGKATRQLVLGSLIEEYHYVLSNPGHTGTAIGHAATPRTRRLWEQFAEEEYMHGTWLAEGLLHALGAGALERSRALPATLALSAQIRSAASTDELGYACCLALCEQSNESSEPGHQYEHYRRLEALDLLPADVFEPFKRHAMTDAEAGHLDFTRVPFEEHPALSLESRRSILGHVFDHVRAYQHFYGQIFEYYGNPANPVIHGLPDD